MRELYRGNYVQSELAFLFECTDETVVRHVNKECHHNQIDNAGVLTPGIEYSDKELLQSFRQVYDLQPYAEMSQKVYDEHKKDKHPSATTIHRRFGSWPEARRKAHNE